MAQLLFWVPVQVGVVCVSLYALAYLASLFGGVRTHLVVALAVLAVYAGATVWLAYLAPDTLLFTRAAFYAVVAVLFAFAIWKRYAPSDVMIPVVMLFAATVGLALWAFGPTGFDNIIQVARERWPGHVATLDNTLPLILADAILAGHVPTPLVGDWLASDRPPLQTGLYLLLAVAYVDAGYQVVGMALQMLCIPACFALARALGATLLVAVLVAVAAFFTPLVLVSGIFVWPKLCAAAYLIFAASLYFAPASERSLTRNGLLFGTMCAAAALLHGGSLFALIGMALAALFLRQLPSLRYLFGVTVSFVALYAPWLAYQRFIDPPGDRLLKWHLAGLIEVDPRPALTAIRDVYNAMSTQEWGSLQIGKIQRLFWGSEVALTGPINALLGSVEAARTMAFNSVWGTLGLAGIGLLATPYFFLCLPRARPMLVVWLVTLAAWLLMMFDERGIYPSLMPNSLNLMLIVFTGLAASAISRRAVWTFVVAQVATTVTMFVF